jgi:hypothetical protein
MKSFVIILSAISGMLLAQAACAGAISDSPSLDITISSAKTLSGVAGDYVTISGQVTNGTNQPINDVTTYLSLVDTENKLPVDLEDWSVEKGLFIGTIDAGQTLPLVWKIHFVKAGTYALTVIADIAGQEKPVVSSLTQFKVMPKKNLNPGQVLPVALSTPILLLVVMALIQYRRSVRIRE